MIGGILMHQTRRSSSLSECVRRFWRLQTLCVVASRKVYNTATKESVEVLVRKSAG